MLFLPTRVLTAVLATAVHATTATTVLPHLAYNGPHSVGQSVVGVHVPTTIAPAVMLPNWQGNELRLHKRAPIGMNVAEEAVDLEKRHFLKYTLLSTHGVYDSAATVSREIAEKPPANWKGLNDIRKQASGTSQGLHTIRFEEARSREKYVKAPLRNLEVKATYWGRKLGGHAVRLYNKEKGGKILAGTTKEALREKLNKVEEKNDRKMRNIHFEYKAPMHDLPHGSGPPAPSQYQESVPRVPPQHHESSPASDPYGIATGHPVSPYHHGPPVPAAPAHYHELVHSVDPYYNPNPYPYPPGMYPAHH